MLIIFLKKNHLDRKKFIETDANRLGGVKRQNEKVLGAAEGQTENSLKIVRH